MNKEWRSFLNKNKNIIISSETLFDFEVEINKAKDFKYKSMIM